LNAVRTHTSDLSREARDLRWLLQNFVEEVLDVHSVAVVSADGLLLLTSQPGDQPGDQPGVQSGVQTEGQSGDEPGDQLDDL